MNFAGGFPRILNSGAVIKLHENNEILKLKNAKSTILIDDIGICIIKL